MGDVPENLCGRIEGEAVEVLGKLTIRLLVVVMGCPIARYCAGIVTARHYKQSEERDYWIE